VLCADDPAVVEMAKHCRGEVIYFGQCDAQPLLDHVRGGGRAVGIDGAALLFLQGSRREHIVEPTFDAALEAPTRAAAASVALCLGIAVTRPQRA
jgi:hypothetical protein